LFSAFEKTTRQTPAASGAKSMFEEKYLSALIEYECSGCDGKTRVHKSHAPTTQARRQATPQLSNEILKTSHG
jgi:hypothetical protein